MFDYYEYADDLVARKRHGVVGGGFEVWVKSSWVPSSDFVRFDFTAQKIDDVRSFVNRNPYMAAAFSHGEVDERFAKAKSA